MLIMNTILLEEFLSEDADYHVRSILADAIKGIDLGKTIGLKEFTFNRFNVKLDADAKRAIIEDELNPSEDGEFSCSLDEFKNGLSSGS